MLILSRLSVGVNGCACACGCGEDDLVCPVVMGRGSAIVAISTDNAVL